jgi:hypothetical protein
MPICKQCMKKSNTKYWKGLQQGQKCDLCGKTK